MKRIILLLVAFFAVSSGFAAEETVVDVESYDPENSLFQKIADLEQEKVLMQLEKEKAQLALDLDRLAAEKARLVREQESADARADEQAAQIEKQKQNIEAERIKLEAQRQKLAEDAAKVAANQSAAESAPRVTAQPASVQQSEETKSAQIALGDKYILLEIVGAGNQLFATLESTANGRTKKISVGKDFEGYTVKSISLDDGVEFEKDGETVTLGVGSSAEQGE